MNTITISQVELEDGETLLVQPPIVIGIYDMTSNDQGYLGKNDELGIRKWGWWEDGHDIQHDIEFLLLDIWNGDRSGMLNYVLTTEQLAAIRSRLSIKNVN